MKFTVWIVLACAAATLSAQTFASPVRNINDPTHAPVSAGCTIEFAATGLGTCALFTVPAGKRLSIRELSVTCSMDATGTTTYGLISSSTASPAVVVLSEVPSNFAPSKSTMGARPVFFQSLAGAVEAKVWLAAGTAANCSVTAQGYLADQQP